MIDRLPADREKTVDREGSVVNRLNQWRRLAVLLCAAGLAFVGTIAIAPSPVSAADPWTITQLTNNRFEDAEPSADAGRVAWTRTQREVWDYWAEQDNDILLKDLSTGVTSNVSSSPGRGDLGAVLRGNLLVWQTYDEPVARLLVRDLAGASTVTLATSEIDDMPGVSDGRYVAWAGRPVSKTEPVGFDREIFLYDSMTGLATQVTDNDQEDHQPALGGGTLVWVSDEPSPNKPASWQRLEGEVFVYDLVTRATVRVERPGLYGWDPATDGRRVVFVSHSELGGNVFVYDLESGTTARLTDDPPGGERPRIEGDAVVWLRTVVDSPFWAIFLHDLSSGVTTRVGGGINISSVEMRGRQIVWQGWAGRDWEVFHHDMATGTTTMLANPGATNGSPHLDGDRVVWAGGDGHDGEIYTAVPASQAPPDTFRDVPGMYPYRTAVEAMAEAGVIAGYDVPTGREFRPGSLVTRAQFVKMLVGSFALPVYEGLGSTFTDLGPNDPTTLFPHDYIATAVTYGITNGTAPGRFSPYANISRAQLATMVVRAAQRVHPELLLSLEDDYYVHVLSDFDPTHAPNWDLAGFNGLFGGLIGYGKGDPWQSATRGEVAQVVWNLQGLLEPQ